MLRPKNCEKFQPLLLEYADGTLAGADGARLQEHLTACDDCTRLAHEMRALRGLLHALPARRTSDGFDTALTVRLAAVRRPIRVPLLPRLLRPAFALSAATAAVAGLLLSMPHPDPISSGPAGVITAADPLVSHCVEQHQRYTAAQPSDPAGQSLAAQIEDASAPLPSDADLGSL